MDYLRKNFDSVDQDVALRLCCIELRRFFKDMPHVALDKRSNFEYLEREVGLHKFLPRVVLEAHKPKALRKLIQQNFKRYAGLGDRECMFKFFEVLRGIHAFDREIFSCALGVSLLNFVRKFVPKIRACPFPNFPPFSLASSAAL